MIEPKFDYLRVVQELLDLEERSTTDKLGEGDRRRWIELSKTLFGLSDALAEKRQYFRVLASLPAAVVSPTPDPEAKVRSLSCGGFFVETDCIPDVGSEMDMKVTFPERHDVDLSFKVRVRWVSESEHATSPRGVGVSFVDLDDQQRTAVLAALRDHLLSNLERTLDRFQFFFDHSPDLSLLITHDTTIAEYNEQAMRLLRPGGEELRGTKLSDVLPAESSRALLDALAKVRLHDATARCELEVPGEDGSSLVPLEALVASGRSHELDLGALVVARDVSERLEIEEQRRSLERRLYQADKLASLGRIAAGIAHDINNPLAWVLSNLSLLRGYTEPLATLVTEARAASTKPAVSDGGPDLEEIDENLDDLIGESLEGVRRIRDIIRDLKMFSRVDVDEETSMDINEVLDTTLKIVRNQVEQRAHVVREYGTLPTTYGNFGKVCQIFLNLIANAITSFDSDDVESNRVTIRSWSEGGQIKVSIRDTGRGIPAELQQKIFEPFFTMQSDEGGTGLGLPIAMDSVKALGGVLELESGVGKGTEFNVSLPVREQPTAAAAPRKKSSTPPERRPRLLVVDDEVTLLRAFQRSLKRRWNVTTTSSVDEALAAFEKEPFEAILCDVMIPGKSGIALHQEIRQRHPGAEMRIVFMTGGAFNDRERNFLSGLPNIVIEKPFDMSEVESLLIDLVTGDAINRGPK